MKKNYLKQENVIPALPNPHFEPIIELFSNREATIEGCAGILEYTDTYVSINCKSYVVNFKGFNFSIKSNPDFGITVNGSITDISFSSL